MYRDEGGWGKTPGIRGGVGVFGGVEVTLLSNFHVYTSPTVLSSTILAKYPDSDPRLPMLQISKERYCRVQLTELYKMRPEPKKGRTLVLMDK